MISKMTFSDTYKHSMYNINNFDTSGSIHFFDLMNGSTPYVLHL